MMLPKLPENPRDQWDILLKSVTIVGAIVGFSLGLYRWMLGQAWQRAAKGRELIDDLLKSNDEDQEYYAWDAMKMLDYQDSKKPFLTKRISLERAGEPESFPVNRALIERALQSEKKEETDPKLLYVRECFDELYFKLGQLQDAIDNKLVELKHVSCPIDYYVELMIKEMEHQETKPPSPKPIVRHYRYMTDYSYQRALKFLENFPAWREVRVRAGLSAPSAI